MIYTQEQTAQVFSWLRAMSPEHRLTDVQVNAGDAIIAKNGLNVFADLIGFTLPLAGVSGQHDISDRGFNIIRQFEGIGGKPVLKAYKDSGGVWTIAFGTIKYPDGRAVKAGDTCTAAQAEAWLKHDCGWVERCRSARDVW